MNDRRKNLLQAAKLITIRKMTRASLFASIFPTIEQQGLLGVILYWKSYTYVVQ